MQRQERNLYGRSVPEEERSSAEDAQDVSIFTILQFRFPALLVGGVVGGCY